jgi:hypothetical protein
MCSRSGARWLPGIALGTRSGVGIPYHILSNDSIEQLMLVNIVDDSDYDSDEPIDLEYVAFLGFDIYAFF